MKHKILNEHDERTIALIFDTGDEPVSLLTRFATDYNVRSARFSAIGAFSEVVLGYFDLERKDYMRIPIHEQVEVVSLLGDVALADGKPQLHAHVVVAGRDATARGGHLLSATVKPTLEVLLIESPRHLARSFDPRFGLALIDVGA
jgi:uncharacterized protein